MTIIDVIFESIATDDYNQSERLVSIYETASRQQKKIIGDTLIAICGFSIPTLAQMAKEKSSPAEIV